MPTHITEIEDAARGRIVLRVEGSMTFEDAVLLEKIALNMRRRRGKDITLDLADLTFLDSESAPVLKRLEGEHHFEIEGLMVFLQKIIEIIEKKEN